ncbi:MAG: FAD:protein FMN transferase [Phycisphaeraceae bacterium]|nr:MAG: FAD:protein FMN transferase [Phycisphaeraceae bacterium]
MVSGPVSSTRLLGLWFPRRLGVLLGVLLGVAMGLGLGCGGARGRDVGAVREERLERHEFMRVQMGVQSRIVLYAVDAASARRGAASAFDRIAALEQAMSDYRPDSEASVLARAGAGVMSSVSDELFDVLSVSEEVSHATDGAFDVTIGPVVRLWREARRTGDAPSVERVREAWGRVGFARVELDRGSLAGARRVRMRADGMGLDFGGIGKGFAAQRAVEHLKKSGFPRCLVALAGDVVVGDAPLDAEGRPAAGWRIDVETGIEGRAARSLVLRDAAVSTSGDSVQFFEIGGVRYAHIIDGRLSRRAEGVSVEDQRFGYRRGVTVVSERGEWADALGTALAIVGPEWLERGEGERVRSLLERFGGSWALIEWERVSDGGVESVEVGAKR